MAAKDSPNAAVEYINETFIPRNDGSASVTFHYSGLDCKVDIRVTGSKDQPAIGFRNEVLPALTRAGCNTGKCHGSASGKDGFRLSLFGYDPAGDQFRLTREQPGRRIHLADPKNSLVVLKATGTVPHTGGGRIEEGSRAYESLVGPRSIWLDSCQRQMNTTSSCRINPPTNENASSIAFWIVQRFKTYGS